MTNGLRAQAGYYGVTASDTTVVFYVCASGYCCDQADEEGCEYEYCAGNRTGRLCGQCEAGMGLVFFSEGCKANSECKDAR